MPVTIRELHSWDMTPQDAIRLQAELAAQVIADQRLPLDAIRLVGGVDVSVKDNVSRAAVSRSGRD
jgi:deoxyribonuclease V